MLQGLHTGPDLPCWIPVRKHWHHREIVTAKRSSGDRRRPHRVARQAAPRRGGSAPIWHVRTLFEDIQRHFGDDVGVTYDIQSLEPKSSFTYPGEGWGLTHDDHQLILSDGSSKLRFLDPEYLDVVDSLEVFDDKIYANVLPQDRIAIIQADTGQVICWIDLVELRAHMPPLAKEPLRPVMNGIAYDAAGHRLFVTGKLWPKVFEIRVIF